MRAKSRPLHWKRKPSQAPYIGDKNQATPSTLETSAMPCLLHWKRAPSHASYTENDNLSHASCTGNKNLSHASYPDQEARRHNSTSYTDALKKTSFTEATPPPPRTHFWEGLIHTNCVTQINNHPKRWDARPICSSSACLTEVCFSPTPSVCPV